MQKYQNYERKTISNRLTGLIFTLYFYLSKTFSSRSFSSSKVLTAKAIVLAGLLAISFISLWSLRPIPIAKILIPLAFAYSALKMFLRRLILETPSVIRMQIFGTLGLSPLSLLKRYPYAFQCQISFLVNVIWKNCFIKCQ